MAITTDITNRPEHRVDARIQNYNGYPNGAEYNESQKRTHLWRTIPRNANNNKRIVTLMSKPSTATATKNDITVTKLKNRLKEVSDYSYIHLLNITENYEWEETLNTLHSQFNFDILVAWGSVASKKQSTETIREVLKTKYGNTKIFEFAKPGSHELMPNLIKANTQLREWTFQ